MINFAASLTKDTAPSEGGRDVDVAPDQLDKLIERRSRNGDVTTDELEPSYAESVRRYHDREHSRIRWEWLRHFEHMRGLHTALATEYENRARQLEETT